MSRNEAWESIFIGAAAMMRGMAPEAPTAAPRKRRAANIAAQVLLILITAGLIVAIWLPAIVGPSKEKQRRDQSPVRRLFR